VSQIRKTFTAEVLKKHYWETEASVDKLFTASSNAEVTYILKTIEDRNLESKLTNQFENTMTLGGPGSKAAEPLLSKPGRLTTSEAGRNAKKSLLTERLHRGTQASVKMGRRQLNFRMGETFSQTVGDVTTLQYEDATPTPSMVGPARLGKRSFAASHVSAYEPMTPYTPGRTPLKRQGSLDRGDPTTPLYGLQQPLSARRANKLGSHIYKDQGDDGHGPSFTTPASPYSARF